MRVCVYVVGGGGGGVRGCRCACFIGGLSWVEIYFG